MPLGKLVFNKVLYNGLTPEVHTLVREFMLRADGALRGVKCTEEREEYVYTLNHPDFIQSDVPTNYMLFFKRVYDPATNSERPCLCKLYSWAEDHTIRLVKTYA